MATITGLTAERMLEIEAASVVDGEILADHLVLTKHDGTTIDAGSVVGPAGPAGPAGAAGTSTPLDGWNAIAQALTFGVADAPSYTVTLPGDLTGTYAPGQRWKLTHAGVVKYFIVTAVAYAAGTTTVTLYGGTDYTLAAGAITLPYFSTHKAPLGFPLNPAKWSVELRDSTDRSQASPTNSTWYNLGSLSLSVPIGAWRLFWMADIYVRWSGGVAHIDQHTTLSTANNTESDVDFSTRLQGYGNDVISNQSREKFILLAAKTSYYLNSTSHSGPTSINFYGSTASPTIIRAVCAYL
jgi:hypothetical protein